MKMSATTTAAGLLYSLPEFQKAVKDFAELIRLDECRRLREKIEALTVHTTIIGSGMDTEVVDCYTVDDLDDIFGDTP
jgi:hypothetical protein